MSLPVSTATKELQCRTGPELQNQSYRTVRVDRFSSGEIRRGYKTIQILPKNKGNNSSVWIPKRTSA